MFLPLPRTCGGSTYTLRSTGFADPLLTPAVVNTVEYMFDEPAGVTKKVI